MMAKFVLKESGHREEIDTVIATEIKVVHMLVTGMHGDRISKFKLRVEMLLTTQQTRICRTSLSGSLKVIVQKNHSWCSITVI